MTPTTHDFLSIVLEERPLIDLRAPVEFSEGAFPNTVNLPLMTDEERHQIGITYKKKGHDAAVDQGYQMVSGAKKQQRINTWLKQLQEHPTSNIFCFRGGQRSRIAQEWIHEATGNWIPRLEGGYKAFRRYLINEMQIQRQTATPILLSGYTGAGKTLLLNELPNSIDLEGIANHRGSSFGSHIHAQPKQISFESRLAYDLIQHRNLGYQTMVVEDEGRHIGKCFVPQPLQEYFKSGELVVLDIPLEERTEITIDEYVIEAQQRFCEEYGEDNGIQRWLDYAVGSINRIQKRLGGQRTKTMIEYVTKATANQTPDTMYAQHREWVSFLLSNYYDPQYLYQLKNKGIKIAFQGNKEAVLEYLRNREKITR